MSSDPLDDLGAPHRQPQGRPRLIAYSLVMIAVAVALAWCARARAHDHYTGLQSPNGADCCSQRDCRPVPWRDVGGIIEYLIDGVWVRGSSVNTIAPIDGDAHACLAQAAGEGILPQPRCLIPPGFGA